MKDTEYSIIDSNGKLLTISSIDKICEMLKIKFEEQEKQNENLRKQLKEITDEKWKDKTLQQLKDKLEKEKSKYCFSISSEELEKINEWIEEHEKTKHSKDRFPRGGAIGGCYKYIFTPTSIGVFGSIQYSCGTCFTFQEEA